jgi:hypothetical protein
MNIHVGWSLSAEEAGPPHGRYCYCLWGEVCARYVICDNKQHAFGHAMTRNQLGRGSVLGVPSIRVLHRGHSDVGMYEVWFMGKKKHEQKHINKERNK